MKCDPQNEILSYLCKGGRLTVRKAERLFHTTELRRVVSRLRKRGYMIGDKCLSDKTEDGRIVYFKEYYFPTSSGEE